VTAAANGRARRSRWQELLRFGAFGVVNTLSYYGSFLVLLNLMPYLAAHVLAYAASMTGSFFLNCRYTFNVRPTWGRYMRFPLAGASTFVVMTVGVTLLVQGSGMNPEIASLGSALFAVPISYFLSRLLLVGTEGAQDGEAAVDGRGARLLAGRTTASRSIGSRCRSTWSRRRRGPAARRRQGAAEGRA
jgi:putative flippase GtrA